MEISRVRLWASPSTLHLSVVVFGKENRWVQILRFHMPIAEISPAVIRQLMETLGDDSPGRHQPGLF
jgi:hypothetical protein